MSQITKNIYLCGFMGCGKSTVGLALSHLLCMEFVDMDTYIEKQAHESVRNIFRNHGEAQFRELEQLAARELSKKCGLVVATGGGAVLSDANVATFKTSGLIVLIDVPLSIIITRLDGDTSRPLLQSTDKKAEMQSLYDTRMPLYRAVCDITVKNFDNSSEMLVARDIAARPEIKKL